MNVYTYMYMYMYICLFLVSGCYVFFVYMYIYIYIYAYSCIHVIHMIIHMLIPCICCIWLITSASILPTGYWSKERIARVGRLV